MSRILNKNRKMGSKNYSTNGPLKRSGHDRRREEKTRQILIASFELFRKRGFGDVSVREIATRAGVSPVTIFTYFGDKRRLIRESVRGFLLDHARSIAELLASTVPYQERVASMIEAKSVLVNAFRGELLEELRERDPLFIDEILNLRTSAMRESIIPLLEEGRRLGLIDPALADDSLIAFFDVVGAGMSTSPGFAVYASKNPDGVRSIIEITLRSMAPREG